MIIMKRLFILSAAVAALASCSNSEVITEVNEPQVPDKAIAFETFSSNATRAENSQEGQEEGLDQHHSNFSVWGYKDVAGSDVTVFNRQTVSYSSNAWTYSPIRFWDKGANSYKFYACAPADAGTSNVFELKKKDENTSNTSYAEPYYFVANSVTLVNETLETMATYSQKYKNSSSSTSSLTNIDYMIASEWNQSDFSDAINNGVTLNFNHILSRLNITVQKARKQDGDAFKDAIVSLTKLNVYNMKSTGSFDESKGLGTGSFLANGTTERWTTQDTKIDYAANTLASVTENQQYVLQSLVIPQTVSFETVTLDGKSNNTTLSTSNAPYIYIKYNIKAATGDNTGEDFVRYINLAKAFGKSAVNETVAFNEGWQNTLHITIDADVISFKPEVYKWDTMHEYDYNAESGNSTQTNNP